MMSEGQHHQKETRRNENCMGNSLFHYRQFSLHAARFHQAVQIPREHNSSKETSKPSYPCLANRRHERKYNTSTQPVQDLAQAQRYKRKKEREDSSHIRHIRRVMTITTMQNTETERPLQRPDAQVFKPDLRRREFAQGFSMRLRKVIFVHSLTQTPRF
jgi:hypothetical protein